MSTPTQHNSVVSQAPARPRRLLFALVLVGAAMLGVGAYWFLRPAPVILPPEIDLAGSEPVIVRAVAKARAAVLEAPHSAAAWGRLGMLLRAHDIETEAKICLARAEELDPQDPRWPYLRGLTLALSQPEIAIPLLERASDLSHTSTAPRLRLAELLLAQGRVEEANRHFRLVLEKEPDNARAFLGLARLARRQGQLQEALDYLQRVVHNNLVRKGALVLRAEVYHQLNATEAARADQEKALQLPDDPLWPDPYIAEVNELTLGVNARLAYASQLIQSGQERQALPVLEEIARESPESHRVFLTLGRVQLAVGNAPAAVQSLQHALNLAPDAFEAHFQLGNALFVQGKMALAEQAFRNAITREPNHALAHYNLAHCRLRQGNRQGAAAEFREVLRYRPAYAEAHRNLGDLLAKEGKVDAALVHLAEAVRLAPHDALARKLLTEVRAQQSKKGTD